jgi:hypothetical protein
MHANLLSRSPVTLTYLRKFMRVRMGRKLLYGPHGFQCSTAKLCVKFTGLD